METYEVIGGGSGSGTTALNERKRYYSQFYLRLKRDYFNKIRLKRILKRKNK